MTNTYLLKNVYAVLIQTVSKLYQNVSLHIKKVLFDWSTNEIFPRDNRYTNKN